VFLKWRAGQGQKEKQPVPSKPKTPQWEGEKDSSRSPKRKKGGMGKISGKKSTKQTK